MVRWSGARVAIIFIEQTAMQSHDIVKGLLRRVTTKHVAQELGVSLSLVYKWAEAPVVGSGTSNPLDRVEVLTRLSDDMAPLEWLCARFGGVFIKPSAESPGMEDFEHSISRIIVELGLVIAALPIPDGEDGPAADVDAKKVRLCWERAKFVIEAFLFSAERGRFSKSRGSDGDAANGAGAFDSSQAKKITPVKYKRALGAAISGPAGPG